MARDKKPASKIDRLLDELMEDGVDAEDLFGEDGRRDPLELELAETRAKLSSHGLLLSLRYAL